MKKQNNIRIKLFSLLFFLTFIIQTPWVLTYAQEGEYVTEVTIKYDLALTDTFLVYDLAENYQALKPEEILEKSEWIMATETPTDKPKTNTFSLKNDRYYLITDSSHELSPIIFKPYGEKQKVVGKRVKGNKIEIPTYPKRRTPPPPNTFVETNTPNFMKSRTFYIALSSIFAMVLVMVFMLRKNNNKEEKTTTEGEHCVKS